MHEGVPGCATGRNTAALWDVQDTTMDTAAHIIYRSLQQRDLAQLKAIHQQLFPIQYPGEGV